MKLRYLLTLSLTYLTTYCVAYGAEIHQIKVPNLIATAQQLNSTGVITVQSDTHRFVYLKISNDHIDKLYPILKDNLPYLMRNCLRKDDNIVGAHITLFEPESITPELWSKLQPLIGKSFSFTPQAAYLLFMRKVSHQETMNQIWFIISVNAPQLTQALSKIDPNDHFLNQMHYSVAINTHINGHCY